MKAVKIHVFGDVQGVSYRYWAQKEAAELGVSGSVKNEHDGSVTILAQGDDEAVWKMIGWANEGSPMASVQKVEVENVEIDKKIKGFSGE